jgi:hypothetical protein
MTHHVERKSLSNFEPVIMTVLALPCLALSIKKLKETMPNNQGNDDAILVRGCIGSLSEVMAAITNKV